MKMPYQHESGHDSVPFSLPADSGCSVSKDNQNNNSNNNNNNVDGFDSSLLVNYRQILDWAASIPSEVLPEPPLIVESKGSCDNEGEPEEAEHGLSPYSLVYPKSKPIPVPRPVARSLVSKPAIDLASLPSSIFQSNGALSPKVSSMIQDAKLFLKSRQHLGNSKLKRSFSLAEGGWEMADGGGADNCHQATKKLSSRTV